MVSPSLPSLPSAVIRGAALAIAIVLAVSGCSGTGSMTGQSAGPSPASGADAEADLAQNALDVLATLDVAPKTEWDGPFDRTAHFGDEWTDPDGNGCDARNDALAEALTEVRTLDDRCRVASGVLVDPYTGQTVDFVRGAETSDDVQIDHVVAVYNAWRTGAQDLTEAERIRFANDPLNLQPTLDWVNDEKASSDASQWLPPNAEYRCTYVARQVAVKATYGLWVTPNEHDAMADVLGRCAA